MSNFCRISSISLFNRKRPASSLQSNIQTSGRRSFGLGRPSGSCPGALPWKEQIPRASLTRVGTAACLITTIVLGCVSCSFVAAAGKSTSNGFVIAYNRWATYVTEASSRFGVPAHWIRAVMQLESTGDKGAVSPKGAMGLMQIMPETYAELRLRYHLGTDPYEPRNNIFAGVAYLREMHDRFGPGGFLAAYNAGPGRYEDYLKRGRPLPEETRTYVATLAPVIGVSAIPRHPESASTPSRMTTFGAADDSRAQSSTPTESRLASGISQLDKRHDARTLTLFAIQNAALERTPANTRMADMTALEPSIDGALSPPSAAAERLWIHTSAPLRSSLTPSSKTLFARRSAHTGN
jgi:Transglycosylase SLT domain